MASELASRIIPTVTTTSAARSGPSARGPATGKGAVRQTPAPDGGPLPSQVPVQTQVPTKAQTPAQSQIHTPDLQDTVSRLNQFVQSVDRQLQFSIDTRSGLTVIKVVDTQTHQVIRQIPAKDVLALARQMHEANKGALFAQKA